MHRIWILLLRNPQRTHASNCDSHFQRLLMYFKISWVCVCPSNTCSFLKRTLPISSVGGVFFLQRGSSVKETSSTMKSGQEKPTGKFSFRASVEREKSPWKGSWQQVTGYCGETGVRDWLRVKWFRLARSLDLKKEASAMLMRLSPGWDDVRAVTAAWESMTHCKKY